MKDKKTNLLVVFCIIWMLGWTLLTTTVRQQQMSQNKVINYSTYTISK